MDIIVCLKRVPDTGVQIELDGLKIKQDRLPWVMNPYDEFALEEAIKIKEDQGATVTVLTVDNSDGASEVLKKAVAMGADQAVCIKGSIAAVADTDDPDGLTVARLLAAAIKQKPFDLILCGKQGTDLDRGMIGAAVAALLDIPVVSAIKKLELKDNKSASAEREVEGGLEVMEVTLPALFTAQKGLNEPRYPSLPGIMKAKKHEIIYIDPATLDVAVAGGAFKRQSLAHPKIERKNIKIEGEATQSASALAKALKEEVKVI